MLLPEELPLPIDEEPEPLVPEEPIEEPELPDEPMEDEPVLPDEPIEDDDGVVVEDEPLGVVVVVVVVDGVVDEGLVVVELLEPEAPMPPVEPVLPLVLESLLPVVDDEPELPIEPELPELPMEPEEPVVPWLGLLRPLGLVVLPLVPALAPPPLPLAWAIA